MTALQGEQALPCLRAAIVIMANDWMPACYDFHGLCIIVQRERQKERERLREREKLYLYFAYFSASIIYTWINVSNGLCVCLTSSWINFCATVYLHFAHFSASMFQLAHICASSL